jgi:hypothetical protein
MDWVQVSLSDMAQTMPDTQPQVILGPNRRVRTDE